MTTQDFKEPDELTKQILIKLLSGNFSGVEELREQIKGVNVCPIANEKSLELKILNRIKSTRSGTIVASYSDIGSSDPGKARVNLYLHVRDGFLYELEYFKDDESEILRPPVVDEIKVETGAS